MNPFKQRKIFKVRSLKAYKMPSFPLKLEKLKIEN